ncbi:unnamed protein product (mitochondrion) [Plasmodiophora brassicae]|uniref:Uncharacterized protein n=1 Tax=Plasmodiophora brassicae TaxID=37360 RepID=A0A3P3Y652_PLABS|nr:unnamed protein product [Plasmodiophora brassicae]
MLNSTWFQNLTLVNTLSIDNNVVSMIAPHTFDGLRRIQKISLKGNRITSIPAFTFNNFSSLTNISLSSNAITSIALGNFNGVPHLLQISIDNNPSLTWLPPGLFASAPSLTTMLESNQQGHEDNDGHFERDIGGQPLVERA